MSRDGHPERRRLLRCRPGRAARRARGRGLPDRARARDRFLPLDRRDPRGRQPVEGHARSTPATGSSPNARISRRRSTRRASRSSARRRRRSSRWATRPRRDGSPTPPACRSCPGRATRSTSTGAKKEAPRVGYPLLVKAAFGGGGKGMHVVRDAESPRGLVEARSARGAVVLRPARGVPRALRRPRAPHRGAGPRRHARQRRVPRRARLLGAAAAPEADRGDAVAARRRRRSARGSPTPRPRSCARRIRQRRHDRVHPRRGRLLLLPRDEHAAPGGAHRHRDGDRPGPRRAADRGRARRLARRPRGVAPRARDPVPDQRRGSRAELPAGPRPRSPGSRSPAARSCGSTRASPRAGRSPATTTRCSRS